jgi:hypothetical protein
MEMIAHQAGAKDIHAVQGLQLPNQVQKIGLVYIVDGQASQGGSGNDMIYPAKYLLVPLSRQFNGASSAPGISDKTGYAGHGTPPGGDGCQVMRN